MRHEMIKILGAQPYDEVRELCYRKEMDAIELVDTIGNRFYPFLPDKSVLIPVPGHNGVATHALRLCAAIMVAAVKFNDEDGSGKKFITLCDCLACEPHPSLCEKKHNGEDIGDIYIKVDWKDDLERDLLKAYVSDGCTPILVDNVVDTGKTVRACMERLGLGPVQVIAIGNTGMHTQIQW